MRGSEHLAVAVVSTGAGLFALNHGHFDLSVPAIAAIAVAGVGSLVPDIDHPKAWISNRIPIALLGAGLGALVGFWFMQFSLARSDQTDLGAAMFRPLLDALRPLLGWAWLLVALGTVLLAIAIAVASFVEHRGPTHSLTVGAVLTTLACVGFAIAGQPFTLGLWFGWGYLTHLLTDLMTPMGCPAMMWPWREGDLAGLRTARPAYQPMTRPVVQEAGTPSQITSAVADGDGGLAQPVEDLQSHMATGFAEDVLAPSDSAADKQSET